MERQSKESRNREAHCKGCQGPPWAVAPSKKKKKKKKRSWKNLNKTKYSHADGRRTALHTIHATDTIPYES
jgi:hypothetical protein